jgi:hypothetical protein
MLACPPISAERSLGFAKRTAGISLCPNLLSLARGVTVLLGHSVVVALSVDLAFTLSPRTFFLPSNLFLQDALNRAALLSASNNSFQEQVSKSASRTHAQALARVHSFSLSSSPRMDLRFHMNMPDGCRQLNFAHKWSQLLKAAERERESKEEYARLLESFEAAKSKLQMYQDVKENWAQVRSVYAAFKHVCTG